MQYRATDHSTIIPRKGVCEWRRMKAENRRGVF